MPRTSLAYPLRIDSVGIPGTGGRIGLTICPGKKQRCAFSGDWDRDLDLDLAAIRDWGAELLVSLIEDHEYGQVGVAAMDERMPAGLTHFRLPIRDVSVPDAAWEREWLRAGPRIRSVLRRGGKVVVHCMGGLGRSGLVAAILLSDFGVHPEEAIRRVREARPGAIESMEQEEYIREGIPAWERLDRFRGCLLAGAAGDALGAPVEFLSRREILARFGPGGIRDFAPAYGRLGAITDDTQMSLFTAEGLLRAETAAVFGSATRGAASSGAAPDGDIPPESFVNHAYLRWLATQGETISLEGFRLDGWLTGHDELFSRRAPGTTCLAALRSRASPGDASEAANDSKGCGGVMRAAPAGLWAAGTRRAAPAAFRTGCATAALTHGHPSGQCPAGALAVLVLELLEGRGLGEALVAAKDILVTRKGHEETLAALEAAEGLAAGPGEAAACIERLGQGWVGEEALAIAVFCALRARSAEEGIMMAVNIDGDSDSTGAIAGNILGAYFGERAIPGRWLEGLELAEVTRAMADDMHALEDWRALGACRALDRPIPIREKSG